MNNILARSATLPTLFAPDPSAAKRFLEFFTANIRNPNLPARKRSQASMMRAVL